MARKKTARTIAKSIEKSYREHRQMLLDSMKGLDKGSRAYLDRLVALSKLEMAYRTERADRGLDPQNLGVATQPKFVFRAIVEPSSEYEWDAKRQALNDELDAEYMTGRPAAEDTTDDEEPPTSAPVAPRKPQPTPKAKSNRRSR